LPILADKGVAGEDLLDLRAGQSPQFVRCEIGIDARLRGASDNTGGQRYCHAEQRRHS
jgi:hypothetical protein